MKRAQVLAILREEKPSLQREFGVRSLALFGSAARDELSPDSDIDILVEFEGAGTSRSYFGTQYRLEEVFGRPVDLVTRRALRQEIRQYVERDLISV
jgi:predicted nucleotidyltransferase